MQQGGPVGWTLIAVADCDMAGIFIPKGATVHVTPGTARPIVLVADLPPNYGAIAGLLCDEHLVQVTGPSPAVSSLPSSPFLQLLPPAPRSTRRCTPRRSSRARLALVR
jgi:hypothetical protein